MTKEEKIQFIAESYLAFMGVEDTPILQEKLNSLSDKELQEEYEFMDYLWDK